MKAFYLLTAVLLIIAFSGFTPNGSINFNKTDISSKLSKASLELKNEMNTANFLSEKKNLKEKKQRKSNESFDLASKSKELGVTEDKLKGMLQSAKNNIHETSDSTQGDAIGQEFIITGTADSKTGTSVAGAGDVNGDGYGDIIVGAPGYNSNTGRAFIYFGGINADNIVDVILTGETVNNNFGGTVSSAGDVNADGYSDVLVAASGYNSNTGRAYIFYGGIVMDSFADIYFSSPQANIGFGYSASGTGDLNGDGYSDVVIGAPDAENFAGKAYLYFGGLFMDSSPDLTMTGENFNAGLGMCVSNGGDFNGDGFHDLLISSPRYGSFTGRVYLYFGGVNMNNTADIIFPGEANGNQFGFSSANAGDVNGDGYSDVIIGAHAYNSTTGRAYIYLGGALPNNSADVLMNGEAASNYFGASVASAGDMNGDGYGDVIVSAYGYNSFRGKSYVYFGGVNMNDGADAKFKTELANSRFGACVSSIGDMDNDGYSEIIIGAYGYSSNTGRAYVYTSKLTGADLPDEIFKSNIENAYAGYSVASAGDVNNDGYSDVIIGGYGYPDFFSNKGISYIFFGGGNSDNIADVTLYGSSNYERFGYSVSGAGDMNGDSFDDVIVGAIGKNSIIGEGGAYIYFGGASMNNIADVVLIGVDTNSYFGYSVSGAGDMNGDGYSDVIIGAPETDNDNREHGNAWGGAYLCLGGSTISTDLHYLETENDYDEPNQRFGYSVAAAGDVNGDGYSDAIVGVPGYDTTKGKVNIFYGGNFINTYPNITLYEEAKSNGNGFGISVAGAGDVNGDGYSDVFIGSPGNNAGGYDAGKAYLYYGGINMNTISDVSFTGNAAYELIGSSISGAGDVNNDGYSDVIMGIQAYPNKSIIFFGGTNMDNIPDIQMKSIVSNSEGFGHSVACAGDVNGDGLSDVIIGAPYNTTNFYQEGGAYLYLSSAPAIIPRVSSVKDVPNDQGGFVNISWIRSGYDVRGIDRVTNYIIERSRPPGITGFQWEQIANVSALNNPAYLYTAATWNDSNSGGNAVTYFRVTARTANNSEYWRSNIMSGYSIDNLAPIPPLYLAANPNQTSVTLEWQANTEPDLHYYKIYRNDTLINTSATNNFTDTFALNRIHSKVNYDKKDSDKNKFIQINQINQINQNNTPDASTLYQYKISAIDIHNNESEMSEPVNVNFSLFTAINVTIIPEGFYNTVTGKLNSRDTVWAYLRNISAPFAIVDSASGVIDSVTFSADFEFRDANDGVYYIVIKHRNSLETWSKTGGESYVRGVSAIYDFTNSNSQSYGSNMILKNSKWCIVSGDVYKDGTIDANDRGVCWNAKNLTGYRQEDVNGDGVVDAQDRGIIWNNRNKTVQRP